MKPNPVVWFEIHVQDMARARKFYEAVFQCQLETLVNHPRAKPTACRCCPSPAT